MSDQTEALRLAGQFERSADSLLKLDQMIGQETRKASQYARAAAELRYQHFRIEADEALMRTSLEALEHALDAAQQVALETRAMYGGYMNHRQKAADADVARIDSAITALRTRLEKTP